MSAILKGGHKCPQNINNRLYFDNKVVNWDFLCMNQILILKFKPTKWKVHLIVSGIFLSSSCYYFHKFYKYGVYSPRGHRPKYYSQVKVFMTSLSRVERKCISLHRFAYWGHQHSLAHNPCIPWLITHPLQSLASAYYYSSDLLLPSFKYA